MLRYSQRIDLVWNKRFSKQLGDKELDPVGPTFKLPCYLLCIVGEVWRRRGVHTVQLRIQNIETEVTHIRNSH